MPLSHTWYIEPTILSNDRVLAHMRKKQRLAAARHDWMRGADFEIHGQSEVRVFRQPIVRRIGGV